MFNFFKYKLNENHTNTTTSKPIKMEKKEWRRLRKKNVSKKNWTATKKKHKKLQKKLKKEVNDDGLDCQLNGEEMLKSHKLRYQDEYSYEWIHNS